MLFSDAVHRLIEDGHDIFLEISPHPILLSSVQQGFSHSGRDGAMFPSMRREEEEHPVMLGSLGGLYALGGEVDWSRLYPDGGRCVRLPLYPWQRERCWLDAPAAGSNPQPRKSPMGATANPFLGRHFNSAHPAETHFWEVTLDKGTLPYLDDHRIEGAAVLPAAVYVEIALAAAAETFPSQAFVLRDVEFRRALFLPDGGTPTIQVILSPDADGTSSIHIYSCPRDEEPTR